MVSRASIIFLVILAVIALVTVSLNANSPESESLPETALLEILGTFQEMTTGTARTVENIWLDYFHLVNLRQENEHLKKSLAQAYSSLNGFRESNLANKRLRKLLNFAEENKYLIIGAEVVGWDPDSWFKTITVNRGSDSDIRVGMPAVTAEGVVGRVVETSPRFAQILLAIDYNSAIDVFVQRSRVRGILAGRSERNCSLKYVLKNDDVVKGDVIVTLGHGRDVSPRPEAGRRNPGQFHEPGHFPGDRSCSPGQFSPIGGSPDYPDRTCPVLTGADT